MNEHPRAPGRKVGVAALADHRDRIDVRSPAEFAEDHIPGAINAPVLDNAEPVMTGVSGFTGASANAGASSEPVLRSRRGRPPRLPSEALRDVSSVMPWFAPNTPE